MDAAVVRREGVVGGQHHPGVGVGGAEGDRAGVAGGDVAVGVQGGDGDVEGHAGGDAGRGTDLESRRRAGLGLEGADVDGAAHDAGEAGAALVPLRGAGVVAGVEGGAAGQERDGLRRAAVVPQLA
jgi:hypothetical protein